MIFVSRTMANKNEMNICECRYTFEDAREIKGSFNDHLNIHEIDEEDSETEETAILERPSLFASDEEGDKTARKEIKGTLNDESVYIEESFCSDESCDESKVTNVTSRSFNSSSLHVVDLQFSQSPEEQDTGMSRWNDEDEFHSFDDEPSRAAMADRNNRFARSKKYRRWNMSFTDEEMRKIERENELLLRKIMAQQKPRQKILGESAIQSRISSSAINRKKLQKKIENDNVLLLKRIQQAKSSVFTNTSKMGCRLTFL
ncbi:uncharacterized protein LOC105840308 [Monomorium pharaonis]|uniref:uncharacterized protein LOC105840308 n=1 Tax=Monomorium pharaonis TaxID=307658 RepID=UPI00063F8D01|nr:uncharacterized protein LOC105840308 [Monomorium pharaonis]